MATSNPIKPESIISKDFDPRQKTILDLYKYYEGVGNNAKTQMASTIAWILAIVSSTLSYALSQIVGSSLCVNRSASALLVCVVGIAVCLMSLYVIQEFWLHTRRNWWRATR